MRLIVWFHRIGHGELPSGLVVQRETSLFEQILQNIVDQLRELLVVFLQAFEPIVSAPLTAAAVTVVACTLLFVVSAVLGEQNDLDEEDAANAGRRHDGLFDSAPSSAPPESEEESDSEAAISVDEMDADPTEDFYELFDRADQLRRDGRGLEAAKLYERAFRICRQADESAEYGVPTEPVREYARMLYHMGVPERAVQVIDEYAEFEWDHGREPEGPLLGLRRRLERGDMRQLEEKYGIAPEATGTFEIPGFIREELAENQTNDDSDLGGRED